MSILKASVFQTVGARLRPSHHATHPNYPSERSGPAPERAVPPGRCEFCRLSPEPCGFCMAPLCPGCARRRCDGSTIHCGEE